MKSVLQTLRRGAVVNNPSGPSGTHSPFEVSVEDVSADGFGSGSVANEYEANKVTQADESLQASRSERSKHMPALDGLRGLAILSVLLIHNLSPLPTYGNRFAGVLTWLHSAGWVGVDLFFVLSGFLITGILLDSRESDHFFRNFYARRFLRIFPLYYAFLFVMIVVLPAVGVRYFGLEVVREEQGWLWSYCANILMLVRRAWVYPDDFAHFWSLAVEEHFYLIWPFIVFGCNRSRLLYVCGALIVIAVVARLICIATSQPYVVTYTFTLCRLDSLAVGAIVATLLRSKIDENSLRRWAVGSLAITAAVLAYTMWSRKGLFIGDWTIQSYGFSFLAILFGSVVCLVTMPTGPHVLQKMLSSPMLTVFGKFSYGLYIYHPAIRNALRQLWPAIAPVGENAPIIQNVTFFLTSIVLTFLVSWASWSLFEVHFLKIKRHFDYNSSRSAKGAA